MTILENRQNVLNLKKTRLIIQLILAWTNATSWQNSKSQKYLWLIRLIFIAPLLNPNLTASAQIVPDNTLPNNSVVTPNSNLIKITGGTTAGNNLFHSFEAFSVLTGQTAYFDNGLAIENILSRITGSSISNIDGLIRANGSANLFLINPNGIVFGENASLDIGGSFVATTADGIKLGEEGFFSASDPGNSQLLTVKPEVFWENSLANVQGTIVNQGNLTVAENLTLSAGNLDLQGQLQAGKDLTLQATDRIQIRGITEQPFVALAGTNLLIEGNQGIEIANSILTSLDNSQGVNVTLSSLENIALTDQTIINVQSAEGGNITINSNNLNISSGSVLRAGIKSNSGTTQSQAGDIDINVNNKFTLKGSVPTNNIFTGLFNNIESNGQGKTGKIHIDTREIQVTNGARIVASNRGIKGELGDIIINASDKVILKDGVFFQEQYYPSAIFNRTATDRNTKNIKISTRELQVTNGARIATSNQGGEGNLGDIVINASDKVILNEGIFFKGRYYPSLLLNKTFTQGDAGNIEINTNELKVLNGARVTTQTTNQGSTGNIIINADKNVLIQGITSSNNLSSALFNTTEKNAEGNSGSIEINTARLEVNEGAKIITRTLGTGDGGNIFIKAQELVDIRGVAPDQSTRTIINSDVGKQGKGNGGDIIISPNSLDDSLIINIAEGAILTASTFGKGSPGNITIKANNLNVSGEGITQEPFVNNNTVPTGLLTSSILSRIAKNAINDQSLNSIAGNISIEANSVNLKNGGLISSDIVGQGEGGDILIESNSVVLENTTSNLQFTSGISSRVGQSGIGNGGDIVVKANNLLVNNGGQIRSGTLGTGNAGNITISGLEQNNSEQVIFDGRKIFDGTIDQQENPIFLGSGNTEKPLFIIDGTGQIIIPSVAESAVGQEAKGNGGTITINTNSLQVLNQGSLNVSSKSQGNVGLIVIKADFLELNNQGKIQAETNFNNENVNDNNISLIIDGNLILQDNSLISAKATEEANGGNVEIDANFIVAFPENNDIIASAEKGKGGNINVTTNALLGIEDRLSTPLNQTNDIDASSEFGLNGSISIEVLEIKPAQGLTKLPSSIIDRLRAAQ